MKTIEYNEISNIFLKISLYNAVAVVQPSDSVRLLWYHQPVLVLWLYDVIQTASVFNISKGHYKREHKKMCQKLSEI